MFDIDWRGLLLPFAYVIVLGGTFVTFSAIYRKRKAGMLHPGPRYVLRCTDRTSQLKAPTWPPGSLHTCSETSTSHSSISSPKTARRSRPRSPIASCALPSCAAPLRTSTASSRSAPPRPHVLLCSRGVVSAMTYGSASNALRRRWRRS